MARVKKYLWGTLAWILTPRLMWRTLQESADSFAVEWVLHDRIGTKRPTWRRPTEAAFRDGERRWDESLSKAIRENT